MGGGCFWCLEAIFSRLNGVHSVETGYAGGSHPNPDYHQVCSGKTGHAEVIKLEYDPNIISYKDLLDVFFYVHDPTTINRQGNDIGEQYRSMILYTSEAQRKEAEEYITRLTSTGKQGKPVVTELRPLARFHPAENYHQDYFAKNECQPYCRIVISPKLEAFSRKFAHLLKTR